MRDPRLNVSPASIGSVLGLWRQEIDTLEIAQRLNLRQRTVCRIIAAEQDRRYAERSAARAAEARA